MCFLLFFFVFRNCRINVSVMCVLVENSGFVFLNLNYIEECVGDSFVLI